MTHGHRARQRFRSSASRPKPTRATTNWSGCSKPKAPLQCSTILIPWRPSLVKSAKSAKSAVRTATVQRDTKETQIGGVLTLEGQGRYEISTGIRFLDHMLELFTKHGGFDLKLTPKGDLDLDQHHTVEDAGIVIGQLFSQALGNRKGINRAGYFVLPMDETLAVVAVDLGGRPALVYKDLVRVRLVGDLQTELATDFFDGFVHHAGANLHAKVLYGRSNHHKLEAIFKSFARAMKFACSKDARLKDQLPSTKGLL